MCLLCPLWIRHCFTINNNRISQQQLWNVIITAIFVLYFWIYNVFLDFTQHFGNHALLMKLSCIENSVPNKLNGIYLLPVMRNLVWHMLKSCFIQCHTFKHCSDMFKLNKHAKRLNFTIKQQSSNVDRIKFNPSDMDQSL